MENYIVTQSRLPNLSNDYLVITFEFNAESCDYSVKSLSDQARPWFRFSTRTSSVAGLAWLFLVAFTRATWLSV